MSESPRNPVSFDELVREHQAGLRAYIRALGAEAAWVDDLAQEVFLVAYREHGRFEEGADFGRWLRGIARHLVLNERRKTARRWRLLHASLAEALADETDDGAGSVCDTTRVVDALNDCVGRLPERSRELLRRRYAEDADAARLAGEFQSNATAIRQTLRRIRQVVRRCVDAKLGEVWL